MNDMPQQEQPMSTDPPGERAAQLFASTGQQAPSGRVTPCVSLCDAVAGIPTVSELEDLLARICWEAGFPFCERLYVGSYFCERFFLGLSDDFHEAVANLCDKHQMGATLVIPLFGQATIDQGEQRIISLLDRFGWLYDEVVVNDIAMFHFIAQAGERGESPESSAEGILQGLGVGRLFDKERRDLRYADVQRGESHPTLSPEALECVDLARAFGARPLVDIDPTSDLIDVSAITAAAPDARIAMHLPYCYATTGRNCCAASAQLPVQEKFRLGQPCAFECLKMSQSVLTDEGAEYVKHGRTHFYLNPDCLMAGTDSWRIVYAVREMEGGDAWLS